MSSVEPAVVTEFPYRVEDVFKAVVVGVDNLPGMHIESQDPATGRILVKAGMTSRSGDSIPITVVGLDPKRTRLDIAPRTTGRRGAAVDAEKNRVTLERILSATSEALKAFATQEPPRR